MAQKTDSTLTSELAPLYVAGVTKWSPTALENFLQDLIDSKLNKADYAPGDSGAFVALTDAATIAWDFSTGSKKIVTLGGNRTLSITNVTNGDSGIIKVIQDGTGFRTLTLPGNSKHPGGYFNLSTNYGSVDVLMFVYDGTNFLWTVANNFL